MSLLGASMLALDGLLCVSVGDCSRVPCGGGVGCCCIGGRRAESTSLLVLLSWVSLSSPCSVEVCVSSGGHVARSCSAGKTTSSGVGIVRWKGSQGHRQEIIKYTSVEAERTDVGRTIKIKMSRTEVCFDR